MFFQLSYIPIHIVVAIIMLVHTNAHIQETRSGPGMVSNMFHFSKFHVELQQQ